MVFCRCFFFPHISFKSVSLQYMAITVHGEHLIWKHNKLRGPVCCQPWQSQWCNAMLKITPGQEYISETPNKNKTFLFPSLLQICVKLFSSPSTIRWSVRDHLYSIAVEVWLGAGGQCCGQISCQYLLMGVSNTTEFCCNGRSGLIIHTQNVQFIWGTVLNEKAKVTRNTHLHTQHFNTIACKWNICAHPCLYKLHILSTAPAIGHTKP